MNIINGIVGALIGGSLVWVLGRAYGEGVGAAKSLFVVGKKAGNEDIKLYIDHKIARDGFITKMIFMQGLNDQLDDCIEAIDSMNDECHPKTSSMPSRVTSGPKATMAGCTTCSVEQTLVWAAMSMPNLVCTGMSRCWMWHRCTRTRRSP